MFIGSGVPIEVASILHPCIEVGYNFLPFRCNSTCTLHLYLTWASDFYFGVCHQKLSSSDTNFNVFYGSVIKYWILKNESVSNMDFVFPLPFFFSVLQLQVRISVVILIWYFALVYVSLLLRISMHILFWIHDTSTILMKVHLTNEEQIKRIY